MTSSWSRVELKETLQNLPRLRVMSMGGEFFSNLDLTLPSSLSCISVIEARISSKFLYVIAETISFWKSGLHFSIRRRDHGANFDRKLDFRSTQGRFLAHVLSLWGNFWCSGRVICLSILRPRFEAHWGHFLPYFCITYFDRFTVPKA